MELTATTTNEVLNHHLATFNNADMEGLLSDYEENSFVLSPIGEFYGLSQIEGFFTEVFKLLPKGSTQLDVKNTVIKDDLAYINWQAESPFVSIPAAADTFLIKNGKIVVQTIGAHLIPKN